MPRPPEPAGDRPLLPRLLLGLSSTGSRLDLNAHVELHGPLPSPGRQRRRSGDSSLIDLVERSGLRGRGGAAFPTGKKMRTVAGERRRPIVVANGVEGEPASAKDKVLLARAPHLVLDGTVLAAQAVGARRAIVCVEQSATDAYDSVARAMDERLASGTDAVELELNAVTPGYVSGEESALVHWLNGGGAVPVLVPPRPYERGVLGQPTLIQNVETLAHLALVGRHGDEWFRQVGTPKHPGSQLFSVSGGVSRPGVYEVPLGIRLDTLINGCGGFSEPAQALLVGGYAGTWYPAEMASELSLCNEVLDRYGGFVGPGVLAVIPRSVCGLGELASVASYMAHESAGQCGPCVHGLGSIAETLAGIHSGRGGDGAVRTLRRWTTEIPGRGACRHPDGAVRFVRSGLEMFAREIELHLHHRRCSATSRRAVLPVHRTRALAVS